MNLSRVVPMQPVSSLPASVAFYEKLGRRARANGLTVPELDTTFYGVVEFRIEDPDGNRLWIGQDAGAGYGHGDEVRGAC